jgi:hypothetical protein
MKGTPMDEGVTVNESYELPVPMTGEGSRVQFATCRICGATVMEDDANPGAAEKHRHWHRQ